MDLKKVLLITVWDKSLARINNIIQNLNNQQRLLSRHNFTPIFLISDPNNIVNFRGYRSINLINYDEKYTNLYKKIFQGLKLIDIEYDYVCKVDDDTLLNFNSYSDDIVKDYDYIGRIMDTFTHQTININLFMLVKTIQLHPDIYNKDFKFASGDCYFLSKKAVKYILDAEDFIYSLKYDRICEDQLFGYILSTKDIKYNNIILENKIITDNCLQITKNYFSIHPINEILFHKLIGKTAEQQLNIITQNNLLNLGLRKKYLEELENKIRQTVLDFVNSKKLTGLG